MAEGPPRLFRIEEENEGDRGATDDFVFRRLGDPVPLKPSDSQFNLEAPPRRPLAISERFRVLFLAHSEGFLVAKTKDAIELGKDIKEKLKAIKEKGGNIKEKVEGPCIQDSSVVDVKIGRVSLLALSNDSSVLAAAVGGEIHFFYVPSLLDNKEVKPSFSCSLKNSGMVKDLRWQKNSQKSFVLLSNDGLLCHGRIKDPLKDLLENVDAVDWSREGDFIAVARKSNLSILSSEFKEEICISLTFQAWSSDGESENFIKVDSIEWARDDSIVVGCIKVNEEGNEEGYLVQVITCGTTKFTESSCKLAVFSFPDLFEGFMDDILPNGAGPYLLLSYLDRWELLLASSKKNIDQHVLLLKCTVDGSQREVALLEFQNEKYKPTIGLQENGDDNVILGFGIDKVSLYEKIEVQVGVEYKELSPLCVLFCLTCEGKLIMYHVARISDPSDIPQSPLPSTDVLLEGELLTISSKHKYDAEGLMSNERTKQIPLEAPSLPTGSALRSARNEQIPHDIKEHYSPVMGGGSSGNSIIRTSIGQLAKIAPSTSLSPQNGPGPVDVRTSTMATVSSLAEGVNVPLFVGEVSNEVAITSQANGTDTLKGGDMGVLPSNVVGFGRVPSRSQSSFFTSGAVASGSREKIAPELLMTSFSQENLLSGSATNLKASGGGPSLLSNNETNSGVRSTILNKSIETAAAIPVSSSLQQISVIGKSSFSQPQSFAANLRTKFSQIDSVLQPAKKLYNGTDMVKELDALLSLIEQEGGFRDACTVFLRSSVSEIEEDLKTLLEISKICRKSAEEELMEIQDVKKKMNEVTAKQLYMKNIVRETSNNQYWDIWNRQKLNPEIELKQQHIWKAYQDLTSQLINLERHFNLVELNKFGGSDTFSASQSAVHCSMKQSRRSQSLHSVYNTINLQLAAAEQLSECLANQMALLNINNSSTKRMGVKKELFESIGLADEGITLESPVAKSPLRTPDSLKRNSSLNIASKEKSRRLSTSAVSCIDPESIRRRRESLEKSCPNFEPPKTIVKRITQKEDARISVDNPFRTAKKQFDSQIETFATIQQKASGNSKYVTPSLTREVQPEIHTLSKDIRGMPSQQISKSPASFVFKWAKEPSVLPQSLGSKAHPTEEIKKTPSQSSVMLSPASSLFPPGSLKAQEPKSYQFENMKQSTTLSSIDMIPSSSLFSSVSIVPMESMASVASASNLSVKSVSPPKLMSNMPKEAPKSTISSLNIASGVSPTKSTSKELVQGNKQLNLKALGEDFTSRLNEGIQQSAASPQSSSAVSNMSSALSFSTAPSSAPLDLGGQTDSTGIVTSMQQPIGTVTAQTSATNVVSSQPLFSAFALSSPPSLISGASTLSIASLSTMASGGLSSFNATSKGEANIVHSVSPPTSTSAQYPVSSSGSSSQSQTLGSTFGTTQSETTSVHITLPQLDEAKSKSESTVQQSSSRDPSASKFESVTSQVAANVSLIGLNVSREPTVLPTGSSIPTSSNSQTEINSASGPVDEMIATGKSGGLDLNNLEEEMEEESSDASNVLNLQSFGGFGLGSASISSPPNPKPNPFGGSFVTANASSASFPHTLTASPGQPFRPASFSLPTVQPAHSSSAFSGGSTSGFSGFGQPSQIGAGQQALGSALGAFGQTRQLGSGGFTGGFSNVANSGFSSTSAFGGTNSGGGFAALASQGGGFASSSTGGFTAVSSIGSGFAGVASGGFAATASGSAGAGTAGFGAVASTTGGFAGAASQSGGFAGAGSGSGLATGGFWAFSSTQGSAFSAFGGSGATGTGRPSSELFTQMRR